jgi:hypothetical protein
MPLTPHQTQLAVKIDTQVREILAQGGGEEALLRSLADYMPIFKQLLDTCTSASISALCVRYDGFYHFTQLLETLAVGITNGSIPVCQHEGPLSL